MSKENRICTKMITFQKKIKYAFIECKEKARTFHASKVVPVIPTLVAHMAACAGLMRLEGRGRPTVLFILPSFFISKT
jgi:hypothetical protein